MYRACLLLIFLLEFSIAQDSRGVVRAALERIGNVSSFQDFGSGAIFTVGQNINADAPWPRVEVKSISRIVDFEPLGVASE